MDWHRPMCDLVLLCHKTALAAWRSRGAVGSVIFGSAGALTSGAACEAGARSETKNRKRRSRAWRDDGSRGNSGPHNVQGRSPA